MFKRVLVACGATLLLVGSPMAGTTDALQQQGEMRLKQQGQDLTGDMDEREMGTTGSGAYGTMGSGAMGDEEPGTAPRDDDDAIDDSERGTGERGTTGSGAIGDDALGTDRPAEQLHEGEGYDAEGNPTGRPSGSGTPGHGGMIRP